MNDPHVNALHYRVVVGKDVDYNNAAPLSETTEDFEFSLDGKTAVFKMKKHYPTTNEANAVVEQYLRAWDILIGLEQDPEDFRLVFDHADIIDRSPDPNDRNVLNLQGHALAIVFTSDASLHVSMGKYPAFPKNFSASPDTETMYLRYKAYRQNRETLTSMAYMTLTILQAAAGGRKQAARKYNIEYTVLDTLGKLTSTKGNPSEARKFPKDGIFEPLRPKEKDWVVSVIKALICRVGEYAYDSRAKLKQLSMRDFHNLTTP
ncbi:MAG: hypothetical protein U9N19_03810 [Thermodesulfobacteriota bacterium]|nr:hypothetical protein [Thermodesulfobacteriota bacterium]